MDVRAIVLVPPATDRTNMFGGTAETLGGLPIAIIEAAGKSAVQRVVERLEKVGVDGISVVTDLPTAAATLFEKPSGATHVDAAGARFWRAAEAAFSDHAQAGAEAVFVLRLGAYTEVNFDELLQFHCDRRTHVTPVVDASGEPLDTFVLNASRRNDAAFLFRHGLSQLRVPSTPYVFGGYCNRLNDAADLRRFAIDILMSRCEARPAGREIKPGVWVEDGARIQRGARLLAPSFVGRRTKVRAASVVTRCSSVEHHCEVDCGTVVENSSVLPYTYIGAGLDANGMVLGRKLLAHLRRQVEVEISDPKLVGTRPVSAPVRALSSALSLTSFLPLQLMRGLFSSNAKAEPTPCLPASLNAPEPELQQDLGAGGELTPDLAVVRRYGER